MANVTPMVINWIDNQPIPLTANNITPTVSTAPTSSPYTIKITDIGGQFQSVNAGGTLTINMPNTLPSGFYFWISVLTHDLTLNAQGGANILAPNGNSTGFVGSSFTFSASNSLQSSRVTFDGSNWWLLTTQGASQLYDIQFVISGGVAPITTGNKGWLHNPVAASIVAWRIFGDVSGSITIDIFKNNASPGTTSMVGAGTKPFVSAGTGNQAGPSGWTTTFLAYDDWLSFDVTASSSFSLVTICLTCARG